MVNTSH